MLQFNFNWDKLSVSAGLTLRNFYFRLDPGATRQAEVIDFLKALACISHHPTVEARDTTARTSLRLLAVLNVLLKYACARQAARASS